MFWWIVLAAVILCLLHILFNHNAKARALRKIPGPKETFLFGNTLELMSYNSVDLMKTGRELAKTHKGIFRVWTFPFGAVNIYNPEDIEIITSTAKYNEKSFLYNILKPWLQDGLLLSKGSKWQERRKILTPAFHFNILRQFGQIIEENSHRLLATLRSIAGSPVDVVPIVSEYTINVICETAMGTRLSEHVAAKSYKDAIHDMGFLFFQRFSKIHFLFDFIYNLTPLKYKQNKYLDVVQGFTRKVISERKAYTDKYGLQIHDLNEETFAYKKKKMAMLDLLLSAEQEGLIDRAGIQEEVDTFMFEGHDTTASGLIFCFMLLANNKDSQDKIFEELLEILGDANRPVVTEDLPKMKYLERCVKESLRLYPPVHFISRNLNEKVVLSNFKVPAGIFCNIQIYDLHRNPDLYKNPNEFDPDRFLPENSIGRHPYAYIPFSAGSRNCIGQKFAMMEMKLAVAEVLREFELRPVTRPSDVQLLTDLVLRNNGPVKVIFEKRQ